MIKNMMEYTFRRRIINAFIDKRNIKMEIKKSIIKG